MDDYILVAIGFALSVIYGYFSGLNKMKKSKKINVFLFFYFILLAFILPAILYRIFNN